MPKTGKLETNNGNNAQCIAQAKEVAIPKISQLIFVSIFTITKIILFAIRLQVFKS
jgi:hypothetical protein